MIECCRIKQKSKKYRVKTHSCLYFEEYIEELEKCKSCGCKVISYTRFNMDGKKLPEIKITGKLATRFLSKSTIFKRSQINNMQT